MEDRIGRYKFSNIIDPQESSYKSYLVTQNLPLKFRNEYFSFTSTITKEEKYDIITTVDISTKEEESFVFHYIGDDALLHALEVASNDYFRNKSNQTILVFVDILKNDSINFERQIEDLFIQQMLTHKIDKIKISTSEVAANTHIDFVSGHHTSLPNVNFSFFESNVVKFREVLKLFKSRKRNGWQAFIIKIKHLDECNEDKMFDIVFLNPEVHDSIIDKSIPVNRSLTVILNCHYEPQLNCIFTEFIHSLIHTTTISVVVKYCYVNIDFMNLKTILYHSCFKYVHENDFEELGKSTSRVTEYIKKLKIKIKQIEKETRQKVVKEISDFYFQQYSILKDNYIKAVTKAGNVDDSIVNMEPATAVFNNSIAVQNFTELGDCSSKIKGLVYLFHETQRQFQHCLCSNVELHKTVQECKKTIENNNNVFRTLKNEVANLEQEKNNLLHKLRIMEIELGEHKHKTFRMTKRYQKVVKYYQTNRAADEEIIKSSKREIHSLVRYINQLQKKVNGRNSENIRSISTCSKITKFKYFRKSVCPSKYKTRIKERVDSSNKRISINNNGKSNRQLFSRIRIQGENCTQSESKK